MQQPSIQQAQQRLDDVTATVDNLSLSNNITITAVDSKSINNNNNNNNSTNNNNNNNLINKVRCNSISENSIGEIASPGSVPEARSPSGASDGFILSENQSDIKNVRTNKPFSAFEDEAESKEESYSTRDDLKHESLSAFRDGCTLFEKYSGKGESRLTIENSLDDRFSSSKRFDIVPKSLVAQHPLSNNVCYLNSEESKRLHNKNERVNIGKVDAERRISDSSPILRDETKERRFSFNKDLVIKPIPSKLQMNLKDCKKEEIEVQNTNAFVLHSWHPHVYAKPPKTPTPHSILDILGTPHKKMCFSPPIVVRGTSTKEKEERLPPSNDDADDEGFSCDEPLNLCLSKSRDVSPSSSIGSRTVTPPIKIPHGMDPSRGLVNGRPELLASSPGKLIHSLKGKGFLSFLLLDKFRNNNKSF